MRAQPAQLRAQVDDELLRRFEDHVLVLVAMLVEPLLAVVAPQASEEAGRVVRERTRHGHGRVRQTRCLTGCRAPCERSF